MSVDIQKLKALAEAATPGPWTVSEEHESASFQGYVVGDSDGWIAIFGTTNQDGDNADYVAAANPAAVLDLIAEIERLVSENEVLCTGNSRLQGELNAYSDLFSTQRRVNRELRSDRDQLKAENERLELENEDTLKKYEEAVEGFTKLSAEVLDLRQQLAVPSDVLADCEAMRLDAERYRWLRHADRKEEETDLVGYQHGSMLDRSIDEIIRKESSHDAMSKPDER